MPKVKILTNDGELSERGRFAWIFCPGCQSYHTFKLDFPQPNGSIWTWNNDIEKPTFSPSMLVNQSYPESRCHSFVRDGKIQFLSDCFHDLKNKTVDLPEVEW